MNCNVQDGLRRFRTAPGGPRDRLCPFRTARRSVRDRPCRLRTPTRCVRGELCGSPAAKRSVRAVSRCTRASNRVVQAGPMPLPIAIDRVRPATQRLRDAFDIATHRWEAAERDRIANGRRAEASEPHPWRTKRAPSPPNLRPPATVLAPRFPTTKRCQKRRRFPARHHAMSPIALRRQGMNDGRAPRRSQGAEARAGTRLHGRISVR
jgi:hypothetical protein